MTIKDVLIDKIFVKEGDILGIDEATLAIKKIVGEMLEEKECYRNLVDDFPSIMTNDQRIGYNRAIADLKKRLDNL